MNAENTEYLYKTYPELYAQHVLDITQTCMCWDFEHGDGWFDIINELSRKITDIDKREGTATEAVQVKEKFGTLRFYQDGGKVAVEDAIDEAENMSAVTCEVCGKPGELRGGGWLTTRCDGCHKEAR